MQGTRLRRTTKIAAIALVACIPLVLAGWAVVGVVDEIEDASRLLNPNSCSPKATPNLKAVETAVSAAAKSDQVSTELIGLLGDCDSGVGRSIEADFAPDLGSAERFVRGHFECGRTKTHEAVPAWVEKKYDWNLEPTRVMNCVVGGEQVEVAVYDEANWNESLAGINVKLASDA